MALHLSRALDIRPTFSDLLLPKGRNSDDKEMQRSQLQLQRILVPSTQALQRDYYVTTITMTPQ
jgi:hypothetical protein